MNEIPLAREGAIPRVSVCIPTYCGAATIAQSIDSVLAQTMGDFELIVVDDGSPDETGAIVQRYQDPRLRLHVNAANMGPEGNWNRCLELASGQYFKLLPHDDTLAPDCLQRQVEALEADQDLSIALTFCARAVLGPTGKSLGRRGFGGGGTGRVNAERLKLACVHAGTNVLGEPGALLFRKSLADRVGPFDATNPYVIDLDYWFRLLEHGDGYYIDDSLASFRVSRTSWSNAIGQKQNKEFSDFIDRAQQAGMVKLSSLDIARSRFAAFKNKWLRIVFYALFLPKLS
jgi:glycosyltransferase involved in cell wall biosynthesis